MSYAPKRPHVSSVQQQQQQQQEQEQRPPPSMTVSQVAELRQLIENKVNARATSGWTNFIDRIMNHLASDVNAYFLYEGIDNGIVTIDEETCGGAATVLKDFIKRKVPTYNLSTLLYQRYVLGNTSDRYKLRIYCRKDEDVFQLMENNKSQLFDIGTLTRIPNKIQSGHWRSLRSKNLFMYDPICAEKILTAYLGDKKDDPSTLKDGSYILELEMELLAVSEQGSNYYIKYIPYKAKEVIQLPEEPFRTKMFEQVCDFNKQLFEELNVPIPTAPKIVYNDVTDKEKGKEGDLAANIKVEPGTAAAAAGGEEEVDVSLFLDDNDDGAGDGDGDGGGDAAVE